MIITSKTFNGHTLNSSDYETALLNQHDTASASPVFIDQAEADAQDAGTFTVARQTKVLRVFVKNYADRYALIAQLKTWFKRGTRGALVGTFLDDGIDYQLDCRVTSLIPDPESGLHFTVMLETGNSAWRAVSEITESTWVVTGTSETMDIAVGGKDETYLSLSLTATGGPASGYLYQNLYQLPNTNLVTHGLIAWCITVNTAALVAAGKMQADCDDLRIVDLNTGQELKRWIDGPNTTGTKVWINLDLRMGILLPLATALASSGTPDYIQLPVTDMIKWKLGQLPVSGILYHGTEWLSYTSIDAVNCRMALGTRGVFGTTMQSHSIGDGFLYIQYPLLMKYGNPSATAPALDDDFYDDTKPLINLNTSSNTTWVWDATTKFFDPDHPARTCGWTFRRQAVGPVSKVFYVKRDAETGDPAIGLKAASYESAALWKSDTVTLSATFQRAATLSTVSMTGDKYRENASWPLATGLYRSVNDLDYVALWTEATPAALTTWETWTHNSVSVATGAKYLKLLFSGGYVAYASKFAIFEALTCTVVFPSTYIPTAAFLGEVGACPLVLTIENITDAEYSDALTLDYLMMLNKPFIIDGELKTVQYDGINAHSAMALDDESRSAFLRLKGNATNTIQISGSDLGTLSVVMRYYRRRL